MLDPLLLGLLAGMLHVLTGPDHLAAIAPLATRPRGAWARGFLWGVGHTSGVWAVGVVALVARGLLPIDLMSSLGDRLGGGALILVGIWALIRWGRPALLPAPTTRGDLHAASAFGILHGLAGTSHYLGILPALGFSHPAMSCVYLACFGLATIGTMVVASHGLGWVVRLTGSRDWVAPLAGVSAVVVGVLWLDGPHP